MSDEITPRMVKLAMLEDLEDSGIRTSAQLKKLGFKPLMPEAVEKLSKIRLPGYEIPYFDPRGRKISFSRLKFFGSVPGSPGQKYWQKGDTLPRAYMPPVLKNKRWDSILEDPDIPIYLTEGEKKAASACIHGIPCIGLGGVWSFKSKKAGLPLIKELEQTVWKGRDVFIVYDNDVMSKPDVMRAMEALASTLRTRGAKSIRSVYLPGDDGQKMGLDDFLVTYGIDEFNNLSHEDASPLLTKLTEMNTRYAIIKSAPERVFSYDIEKFVTAKDLVTIKEAPNRVDIINENNKPQKVSVAKEWLQWTNRTTLNDIVFKPGDAKITEDNCYNLWEGFPYTPIKGDVKPFLNLVDHIFEDLPREIKNWFLQWCALPLQEPGTKLFSAVLVWGGQGTGKTFLGKILKSLYGPHGKFVEQVAMQRDFNEWAVNTQFAVADEVIYHGDRRESNILKNVITREEVTINRKYQPTYTVNDITNYFFTSNHSDALHLEPDDRRFLIIECNKKQPDAFYSKINKWLKDPSSYNAILYYLLNEVNCKGFNAQGPAPVTRQKQDMIHESMSSLDQAIMEMVESPNVYLQIGGTPIKRDVFTAEEIRALLPSDFQKTTLTAIGKALRKSKCPKMLVTIRRDGQTMSKRIYAVRNIEKLSSFSHNEWTDNYLQDEVSVSDKNPNVLEFKKKSRKKKFVSPKS